MPRKCNFTWMRCHTQRQALFSNTGAWISTNLKTKNQNFFSNQNSALIYMKSTCCCKIQIIESPGGCKMYPAHGGVTLLRVQLSMRPSHMVCLCTSLPVQYLRIVIGQLVAPSTAGWDICSSCLFIISMYLIQDNHHNSGTLRIALNCSALYPSMLLQTPSKVQNKQREWVTHFMGSKFSTPKSSSHTKIYS